LEFAPIAFVSGNVGSFLKRFGLPITVAMLNARLICFRLTQILASGWLKEHEPEHEGAYADNGGTVAEVSGALVAMAIAMYAAMADRSPSRRGSGALATRSLVCTPRRPAPQPVLWAAVRLVATQRQPARRCS
jgi:multidrug efflux pump subunit AcrB